jgi:tRNA G37 N-methylase TrmD
MRIDILCLFPEMFVSPLNQSIIKRAREQGLSLQRWTWYGAQARAYL